MRIGYINYMNCFPFYYHMMEKKPLPGIEVVPGHPSDLNRMMGTGELCMSPVSAAAYADLQDDVVILPDFCLSSIGYVRSVILISRMPIEDLDGKRLGLSSASQTSVALLKILLERYYGIRPAYLPTSPRPSLEDIDAALVMVTRPCANDPTPSRCRIPTILAISAAQNRPSVVFAIFTVRDIVSSHRRISHG